ncbi:DUF1493 family protein [Variovorax sp. J31P179]|uniref:DUF1493 family protein n=1 Tax=Variovorax sp. J31P179 TaxID=3053508 RepID=UPI00257788C6|nr:DUF1493 family protein [Variovorax sp. J31P179]MDM0081496.1 DUF1493 family protein [Variovorax sp. J31P179]
MTGLDACPMVEISEVPVQADLGESELPDFETLYLFLAEWFPEREFNDGSPNWRLEEDLDCYGDDAYDLLARFSEQFHVDVAGFDLSAHFAQEGHLAFVLRKLFRRKRELKPSPSIRDLKHAIETGKLG